jgi:hypothetical protein
MRKELQFVQLVKVDNVYNFYKYEGDEVGKSKVEFFAVYLNTKNNLLEFFPIEKTHLIDGMDFDYFDNSGFLETIDLSHSHWLPLTEEDKQNEEVKRNLKNSPRWQ